MAHRTKAVTTGPQTAVALCSCGWAGNDRHDLGAARTDANRHEVESLRAEAKPATKP